VQNSGKERKAQTMGAFSTIGIVLMVCALNWIDSISSPSIQGFAETVISLPLVVLLLSGSILSFLIYMFKGQK
jgi:peptidoglycan/LPS O-acetylase OafA/YrhL